MVERFTLKSQLSNKIPVPMYGTLSVWPSTIHSKSGLSLTTFATLAKTPFALSVTSYFLLIIIYQRLI
jgi:hypothetical protein